MQLPKLKERRGSARWSIALEDVAVYLDGRAEPLRARAENFSLGGVFLHTPPLALPLDGLVGVLFRHGEERYHVLGVVTRRARDGAALRFINSGPEVARLLRELAPAA